jgi:hypothetical protein
MEQSLKKNEKNLLAQKDVTASVSNLDQSYPQILSAFIKSSDAPTLVTSLNLASHIRRATMLSERSSLTLNK